MDPFPDQPIGHEYISRRRRARPGPAWFCTIKDIRVDSIIPSPVSRQYSSSSRSVRQADGILTHGSAFAHPPPLLNVLVAGSLLCFSIVDELANCDSQGSSHLNRDDLWTVRVGAVHLRNDRQTSYCHSLGWVKALAFRRSLQEACDTLLAHGRVSPSRPYRSSTALPLRVQHQVSQAGPPR